MSIICPTILAETPGEFSRQIVRLEPFAKRVQIDLMDGEFAPSRSINLNQVYWPENWTVDIHLMYKKPLEWIEMLVSLKPNLVIVHAEAEGDLAGMMNHIKQFGIKTGVALLKDTPVESAWSLMDLADHILLFSGNLGHFGGTVDFKVLDKVDEIRSKKPDVEIGWDGGANLDNVRELAGGGIDVINVGGAIAKANNPAEIYKKMVAEATA